MTPEKIEYLNQSLQVNIFCNVIIKHIINQGYSFADLGKNGILIVIFWASFIFTLHLAEKWQRHPAADLSYKPLLQFTIFSSNKSVNCLYLKKKDAIFWILFF